MKLNRFLLLAASNVDGSTVEQPSTSLELVDFRPEDFNLPTDYTFASKSWGNSFYKIYNEGLDYGDAKAQCESDGSFLAIPRSKAEEAFRIGYFPDDLSVWMSIHGIEQEGFYVARGLSWTNWGPAKDYWSVTVKKLQKFICAINIEGKIFISELSSELHLGITLHVKTYTNMFI